MAEVTQELMYELLRKVHVRLDKIDNKMSEFSMELIAIRGSMVSMQSDIHNIYGILSRHEQRLDRIENRLELRELAEASQTRYEPHP